MSLRTSQVGSASQKIPLHVNVSRTYSESESEPVSRHRYVGLVGLAGGGDGEAAKQLADRLAQQVVAVDPGDGGVDALLASPYLFDGDRTVSDVVAKEAPGATVTCYLRWGTTDHITSDSPNA